MHESHHLQHHQGSQNRFKFRGKWFWVGIAIGFFNLVGGLIYGIAMASEKEHRREGWFIVIWTIAIFFVLFAFGKFAARHHLIPQIAPVPDYSSAIQQSVKEVGTGE